MTPNHCDFLFLRSDVDSFLLLLHYQAVSCHYFANHGASRAVVLNMWVVNQQHQHHWELAGNADSQAPPQTLLPAPEMVLKKQFSALAAHWNHLGALKTMRPWSQPQRF